MNSSDNKVKNWENKDQAKYQKYQVMSAQIVMSTKKNTPSTNSLSSNSLGMASTSSASKEEDDSLTQNDQQLQCEEDSMQTSKITQHMTHILPSNQQPFFTNFLENHSENLLPSMDSLSMYPKNHKDYTQSQPDYQPEHQDDYPNQIFPQSQQCRWESSGTLSIESPYTSASDKEIEQKISAWLDQEGVKMVSPSKKSRDYFEKKKNHIHLIKTEVESHVPGSIKTTVPHIDLLHQAHNIPGDNSKPVVVEKLIFHSPLMQRRLNMMSKASSTDDSSMKNISINGCSCNDKDEKEWRQTWGGSSNNPSEPHNFLQSFQFLNQLNNNTKVEKLAPSYLIGSSYS